MDRRHPRVNLYWRGKDSFIELRWKQRAVCVPRIKSILFVFQRDSTRVAAPFQRDMQQQN